MTYNLHEVISKTNHIQHLHYKSWQPDDANNVRHFRSERRNEIADKNYTRYPLQYFTENAGNFFRFLSIIIVQQIKCSDTTFFVMTNSNQQDQEQKILVQNHA